MKLVFPRVYAIMDGALLRTSELIFAEMLAEAGVALIQYRHKQASSLHLFDVSEKLARFLGPRGVRFVVNDRPDIAALVGAGGVHVGQEDLAVEDARAVCGVSAWVGVSTHTPEQVRPADQSSADYIAVGPIFATRTKKNAEKVAGLDFIRRVRQLTRKPVVAIGGITLERAGAVLEAGADAVAVARDLLCADDPGARARQFLNVASRFAVEIR